MPPIAGTAGGSPVTDHYPRAFSNQWCANGSSLKRGTSRYPAERYERDGLREGAVGLQSHGGRPVARGARLESLSRRRPSPSPRADGETHMRLMSAGRAVVVLDAPHPIGSSRR
jgi:hypothetical protein